MMRPERKGMDTSTDCNNLQRGGGSCYSKDEITFSQITIKSQGTKCISINVPCLIFNRIKQFRIAHYSIKIILK